MEREYRTFLADLELRKKHEDEDKEDEMPMIRGYAARFDSLSEDLGGFREQIRAGAFDDVLKTAPDVRALVDHDQSRIIGRTLAGTLRLNADQKGLYCEIDPPNTSVGRDLVESIKRGDIDSMSFGFTVDAEGASWDFPDSGPAIRTLNKIRNLFDVSAVTFPAYRQTDLAVAQRSLEAARAEETKQSDKTKETLSNLRNIIEEKSEKFDLDLK